MSIREYTAFRRVLPTAWALLLAMAILPTRSSTAAQNQQDDLAPPPGTILPVRLNHSFSSGSSQQGQTITARVMQRVPLPNGEHIRKGTTVIGHVVAVQPASEVGNGQITIQFDRLLLAGERQLPIRASLRALAGTMSLEDTQLSPAGADGSASQDWDTLLLGDGVRYGYYGPVTDAESRELGKSVPDGVLAHPEANPRRGCDGSATGGNDLQAMWLFSPDACGVYGVARVEISNTGGTNPQGQITLTARNGDVKVGGGVGMLLRVVSGGTDNHLFLVEVHLGIETGIV